MLWNKKKPTSSSGQQKNDIELAQKVKEWKSPSNLPDGLKERIDEISLEIWNSKGLPVPISKFFDDLYEACNQGKYSKEVFSKFHQGCKESLDRTSLSEWCLAYRMGWSLYSELRGHIFSKYDPNREEDE